MNKEPRLRFTEENEQTPRWKSPSAKRKRPPPKRIKRRPKSRKEGQTDSGGPGYRQSNHQAGAGDKKKPPSKLSHSVRDAPGDAALGKIHKEIRETNRTMWAWKAPTSPKKLPRQAFIWFGRAIAAQTETLPQGGSGREKAGKGQCKRSVSEVFAGKSPACQHPFSRWQQKQAIKKEYCRRQARRSDCRKYRQNCQQDRQGGKNRQGKGTAGGCVCHAPQERGWHRAGPLFGGLPPDEHHFLLLYAGSGHRFCGDRQHLPLR